MLSLSRVATALFVTSTVLLPVACAAGNPTSDPVPDVAKPAASTEPSPAPTAAPTSTAPKKDPDEALAPEVYFVSPDKATVGGIGPSLVITGNNFVPRSIIQLDGAPLATSFVSGTELRATVPTSKLAVVGTLHVSVGTSPPGGGASKEVTFEVQNPAATLTAISPLSVVSGASTTALHVTGSGFAAGATVYFGTTSLVTTFGSSTSLDATIPSNLLVTSSSVPVKVVNPPPGGGDSSPIAFTVANPSASIQQITPAMAYVGSASVPLTVDGTGFVNGSTIRFNGAALTTTFVNASRLTATVPATSFLAPGDLPVAVGNPPPGGGVSAPALFRVQYPTPVVASVGPSTTNAGAGPTEVTVTGTGFFQASQITFDNSPSATTYVDATHLKATLTAAQLATGGTISVRVVNPTPGGGVSSATSFTVTNPAPSITTLNPATVAAGSGDTAVTISGASFLPTSTVKSNGVLVMTNYVSPTQLSAVVPSNHLLNPGNVAITVTNPSPGGGTSVAKNLVVGCDSTGVDVALGAVGNVTTLATNFATAPKMARFSDSGSCATSIIDPAMQQPARYWVVQNTAGAPVTLSAWAVCLDGLQDDAYLAFYKRPTVPANDNERLACFGDIAEGVNGPAGRSSPESGASMWCPGLTKANGGGLVLAACEKAVVHLQAYSSTSATYTMPPQLKLKPE